MANNNETKTATLRLNGKEVTATLNEIIKLAKQTAIEMQKATAMGDSRKVKQLQKLYNQCQQEISKMAGEQRAVNEAMKNLGVLGEKSLKQIQQKLRTLMMDKSVKQGSKEWNDYMQQLKKVEAQLNKVKNEKKAAMQGGGGGLLGLGNLSLGTVTAGLTKLAGAFGLVLGAVQTLKTVMTQMYSLNKDFEKQTAELASVLGTTRNRIPSLIEQAKQLGETTMYTASEVAGLQINLAKLGFSTQEIKDSTAAILDFAAATGAALPEAATVAGAALRAFGADSKEMERYVSTMAVATTKSALDFEKLRTSVGTVFPAANAFGFSIEDTVTLLAKLSDAGYEASTAATALRNIFIAMSNTSSKFVVDMGGPVNSLEDFVRGLNTLQASEKSIGDLSADVGKRAAAPLQVLVNAAPGIMELRKELDDCGASMKAMVDERMNTLWGSTKILQSAWQGLMLNFQEGNGVIRSVNEKLIEFIQWITKTWKHTKEFTSDLYESSMMFRGLLNSIVAALKTVWNWAEIVFDGIFGMLRTGAKSFGKLLQGDIKGFVKEGVSGWADMGNKIKQDITDIGDAWKDMWDETTSYQKKAQLEEFESVKRNLDKLTEEEKKALLSMMDEEVDIATASIAQLEKLLKGLRAAQKIAVGDELQRINSQINQVEKRIKELKGRNGKDQKTPEQIAAQEEAERQKRIRQETKTIDALEKLDKQRAENAAENMKSMGDDEYDVSLWLADEKYRIEAEALAKKLALYRTDEDEYERVLIKMEEAAQHHEEKIAEINNNARKKREKDQENFEKAKERAGHYAAGLVGRQNPYEKFREQLKMLDEYHKQGLLSEEQYQKAVDAVQQAQAKKTVEYINKAMQEVNTLISSATSMVQARYDAQIASVERRYEAEIESAEKAGKDTTEIEKKKEEEIRGLQLRQAKADYDASVAQTFIDAAMASSKVWVEPGWPWAIALQAVIAANQVMQLSTLRSNYDAKIASIGQYFDGGYTSGSNYRREAGVVHEGEFVANHRAVNNPEIRPMLDALDYAQKHNSVSSLTREDLALAAGYASGGYTAGTKPSPVNSGNGDLLRRIYKVLDHIDQYGVYSNILTSDIRKGLDRDKKLENNKSRI